MAAVVGAPEMLVCPYNEAHIIEKHRMPKHLVKCRKSVPDLEYVLCPFNSTHRIPEAELNWHCETCLDRHKVDTFIFKSETFDDHKFPVLDAGAGSSTSGSAGKVEPPMPSNNAYEQYEAEEESWDNLNYESYNPNEYCENSAVLRQLNGESKGERKKFRNAERRRLDDFN